MTFLIVGALAFLLFCYKFPADKDWEKRRKL